MQAILYSSYQLSMAIDHLTVSMAAGNGMFSPHLPLIEDFYVDIAFTSIILLSLLFLSILTFWLSVSTNFDRLLSLGSNLCMEYGPSFVYWQPTGYFQQVTMSPNLEHQARTGCVGALNRIRRLLYTLEIPMDEDSHLERPSDVQRNNGTHPGAPITKPIWERSSRGCVRQSWSSPRSHAASNPTYRRIATCTQNLSIRSMTATPLNGERLLGHSATIPEEMELSLQKSSEHVINLSVRS